MPSDFPWYLPSSRRVIPIQWRRKEVTEKDITQSNEPWCEWRDLLTVAFFISVPKIRRRNNGAAPRFDLKRFFLHPLVKRFPVLKEMWNQSTKRNKTGKIGRHVWNALAGRKRRAGGIQSNVSFSWRRPLVKLITYCVGPSHHIVELWNQVNIYNGITRNISNWNIKDDLDVIGHIVNSTFHVQFVCQALRTLAQELEILTAVAILFPAQTAVANKDSEIKQEPPRNLFFMTHDNDKWTTKNLSLTNC